MTPDELRALIDAADAYKRQEATVAQVNLWLGRFPSADVAALARIALAAVEHERVRSAVAACRVRHLEEYDAAINAMLQSRADLVAAIADAGLSPPQQEPQP